MKYKYTDQINVDCNRSYDNWSDLRVLEVVPKTGTENDLNSMNETRAVNDHGSGGRWL